MFGCERLVVRTKLVVTKFDFRFGVSVTGEGRIDGDFRGKAGAREDEVSYTFVGGGV